MYIWTRIDSYLFQNLCIHIYIYSKLTMHKALQPRDDIDRLYVLRKKEKR